MRKASTSLIMRAVQITAIMRYLLTPIRIVHCLFFFFLLQCTACGILVPWSGIKRVPPALGAQSLNYWTTREVPFPSFLWDFCFMYFDAVIWCQHVYNSSSFLGWSFHHYKHPHLSLATVLSLKSILFHISIAASFCDYWLHDIIFLPFYIHLSLPFNLKCDSI